MPYARIPCVLRCIYTVMCLCTFLRTLSLFGERVYHTHVYTYIVPYACTMCVSCLFYHVCTLCVDVPLLIVCTWWMYLMRVLSESPHVTVVVDVLVQRRGASREFIW